MAADKHPASPHRAGAEFMTPPQVADLLRTIDLRCGYIIGTCKDTREMRLEAEEMKRLVAKAHTGLYRWWHGPARDPDTGELRPDLEAVSERVYGRLFDELKTRGIILPGCDTTDKALEVIEMFCRDETRERAMDALQQETAQSASPRSLVAYIDALFVSGNEVPTTTTLLQKSSWDIIKECLAEGLPLDYHVVEAEAVYRRKLAAYGDATRATSPLDHLRARTYTADRTTRGE